MNDKLTQQDAILSTTGNGLFLIIEGDNFIMTGGKKGNHTLHVGSTDFDRLHAHWCGYIEASDAGLATPIKHEEVVAWYSQPEETTPEETPVDYSRTIEGYGLRLTISELPDDREGVDVWVETLNEKYCSSLACALGEEELLFQGSGSHEDKQLSSRQLNWLGGNTVQEFLDEVGY